MRNLPRKFAGTAVAAAFLLSYVSPCAATSIGSWPQFLGDDAHSSYVADPALGASNASQLGVKWMANLYSPDLGSPVVAFNATLNKTVVYIGNERGDVYAIDAATGANLWSTNVGINDKLRATPMIAPDGNVWVGTSYNATLYKLDGATGAVDCSVKSLDGLAINGSPMTVQPPGGHQTVFWDSIDGSPVNVNGPIVASNESNCSTIFSYTNYRSGHAGPWTTPAYGVSAKGEPLVLTGTADTDSTEYAVNAVTGSAVWNYHIFNPADYDIGDGATVSPTGNNGFADGVVYFNSKYGIEYANDLTTGANLWQFNMYPNGFNGTRNTISSAALDRNTIAVGYSGGLFALNATTGAQLWQYTTPAEVASSPAIVGGPGNEVVAFADLTGKFRIVNLASGLPLYTYKTGGYITSSPAVANGTVFIASTDGFLYAYGVSGSNASAPTSAVTSPSNASTVTNPSGNLTVTGSSTDASGVNAVEIAIESNGSSGPWYNAASGTFGSAPIRNHATVTSPGATSTTWSIRFPVPASGGTFKVFANSVNTGNIVDRGATSSFSVSASTNEPTLHTSTGFIAPGNTFTATGNAFKPGETVTFSLFGANVATAVVGATGNVPRTTIPVADTATFGPTSLTATGGASGKVSSTSVTITNEWTQQGYSSSRGANEPHDPIIQGSIDAGQNVAMALSWLYATGAPVNTSPAVVNGVAYIGNDAGTLTAVGTQSGAPQWKFTVPSASPIRSSPAVDPSGNVIFGANDGNLYFLDSSGALKQTIPLGGSLGAPAVTGNKVIIASANGSLFSIANPAGTKQWTATLSGTTQSAPAYDAVGGVIIIGDNSGAVTAFNSGTGVQRWKYKTGGAVTAAPSISNKNVYIGSADGYLYAFREATGALEFKFKADSAIVGNAAVGGSADITFGTQMGTIYQVSPTGAQKFMQAGHYGNTAISGVSAVDANAMGETIGGLIGLTREAGTSALNPWSYQTAAGASTEPAILNGTAYMGAQDGNLYAFSPNGATPQSIMRGAVTVTVTNGWSCSARQ